MFIRGFLSKELEEKFNEAVNSEVENGWRVVGAGIVDSGRTGQVILQRGKQPNVKLHVFLSFATLGFWYPIAFIWERVRLRTLTLEISTDGEITRR